MVRDIDWSTCDADLRETFDRFTATALVSPKDRDAPCVSDWADDPRSSYFPYGQARSGGGYPFDAPHIRVA